jgi:GNAT superfamily N-acetyltransferase
MTSALGGADIEAIVRATYAAVVPEAIEELEGWLLGFDSGTVGRAKSAAPLAHDALAAALVDALIDRIVGRYVAHRLPPVLRIAVVPGLDAVRDALARRGFRAGPPTLVQVASTAQVCRVGAADGVHLAERPDAIWTAAFLGDGFDPVDGASRARTLARSADTVFASVREGSAPGADFPAAVGAGAVSFGFGWGGIHGMRTAQKRRGEGIAARILGALARVAAGRNVARLFLQVDAKNAPAITLYRRAGFATAWTYEYWSAAADAGWRRAGKRP